MSELPMIGKPTEREKHLAYYLGHCVANYIEIHETERRELISGLFSLSYIVFDKQSPFSLEGKLKEVDAFCHIMKEKILGKLDEQVD